MQRALERHDQHLIAVQQHLQHLNPQQVLARGYSMVRDELGVVVVDGTTLAVGEMLQVTFAQGRANVEVKKNAS